MTLIKQNTPEDNDELAFAIDAAELGTWDLDPFTGRFKCNNRLKMWFGLGPNEEIELTAAINAIIPSDRERVTAAINRALDHTSGGKYNIEYSIINSNTNHQMFVVANGKAWFNEQNQAYRFNGILQDITEQKLSGLAQKKMEDQFEKVANSSPTGLWLSDVNGQLTYINKTLVDWTGMAYEELLGNGWANAIIEEDRQKAIDVFSNAINNKHHYKVEFRIRKANNTTVYCRAEGDPFYNENGVYAGYAGYCLDIEELLGAIDMNRKNEVKFRSLLENAPIATCLFTGPDHVIEIANEMMLNVWGKSASVIGLPLIKALPELEGQPFIDILNDIYITGKPFSGTAIPAHLLVKGKLETFYFDFTYKPILDDKGKVYGIMDMAVDVSLQVRSKKELEEAELFARNVIDHSPVAKIVYIGEQMTIKSVNRAMFKLLEMNESIIGKTYSEVFPQLQNTHMPETMLQVYKTGITYEQNEERIMLVKNGKLQVGYYSYIYKALKNTEGIIYGIIVTATDITSQVIARQKVEDAETKLNGAIELAQLGTWSIDIPTKKITYSPRMREWLGINEAYLEGDSPRVAEQDRARVMAALRQTMTIGGPIFDEVYAITNQLKKVDRIIHAHGQLVLDEAGNPSQIIGTAQDVTLQKQLQLALETEVQKRTEELEAINEEMTATNEELADSNKRLTDSNAELEQYAYVASHDLQEPLRKMRIFSGRLAEQPELASQSRDFVEKINRSAERMSLLIKDLLEFSRLLKSTSGKTQPVDLNKVVQDLKSDFELLITEKEAQLKVGELPTINAVPLHMNQLFYNLINNALKFSKKDVKPVIIISAKEIKSNDIPEHLRKPGNQKTYHKISVSDNGIGIDAKYYDQIFEVFKRLHEKSAYDGSGVGLAICKKIVNNLGGVLYVESEPGKGSQFNIIIPCV